MNKIPNYILKISIHPCLSLESSKFASKSVQGSVLYIGSRKNKYINNNNNTSPNCPEDTCEGIFINCGTDVPLVINPYKLYVNLFKGFNFTGGSRFSIFRLDALALSVIATATRLAGWVAVTPGIVSKRLNLSEKFWTIW